MKITLVVSADPEWTGIYVDGELRLFGRDNRPGEVMGVLGIPFDAYVSRKTIRDLPPKLEDYLKGTHGS